MQDNRNLKSSLTDLSANRKKRERFDRSKLKIRSLNEREHDLDLSAIKSLKEIKDIHPSFDIIAKRIIKAKELKASVILMIGAHVIRAGVQKYIIDLMEKGYLSCIAMNGAGIIHDFEFALIGATTESVAKYIKGGQFGLWKETGILNDIINQAYKSDNAVGLGEAVGQAILHGDFPHKDISLLAAAYRLDIPVTVHVGVGYDIIHEHPNCDGAATGSAAYEDFLIFAGIVQNLENGVVMNFGSAVMAPEIYLKALSMARNAAHQKKKFINHFTTLVCDLYEISDDFHKEPSKNNPAYFFRPWKTMLVRTVADGGESFYIKGDHADTIPSLWTAINVRENKN